MPTAKHDDGRTSSGGHVAVNRLRVGAPEYVEIGPEYVASVRSLCLSLGVTPVPDGIVAMEEAVLRALLERAIAGLGESGREDVLRRLREAHDQPVGFANVSGGGRSLLNVLVAYNIAAGTATEPLAVRIPEAQRISGLSRSEIYRSAGQGKIVMLKCGRSTLVEVRSLREAIASLPRAEIRPPR